MQTLQELIDEKIKECNPEFLSSSDIKELKEMLKEIALKSIDAVTGCLKSNCNGCNHYHHRCIGKGSKIKRNEFLKDLK